MRRIVLGLLVFTLSLLSNSVVNLTEALADAQVTLSVSGYIGPRESVGFSSQGKSVFAGSVDEFKAMLRAQVVISVEAPNWYFTPSNLTTDGKIVFTY